VPAPPGWRREVAEQSASADLPAFRIPHPVSVARSGPVPSQYAGVTTRFDSDAGKRPLSRRPQSFSLRSMSLSLALAPRAAAKVRDDYATERCGRLLSGALTELHQRGKSRG
jgi:hypothetical protein